MANQWTVFGSSNQVKYRRYRVTGPQETQDQVRQHMATHYPHFQITSVHPGRLDKEPSAPAVTQSAQEGQE